MVVETVLLVVIGIPVVWTATDGDFVVGTVVGLRRVNGKGVNHTKEDKCLDEAEFGPLILLVFWR